MNIKKSIFRQRFYLLILLSLLCFGCGEKDEKEICDFNDPLTDLLWLREIIKGYEENVEAGYKPVVQINQCTYKNGTGFLIDDCVGCPDSALELINCKGERLCLIGGYAGLRCEEYEVDIENKKLIFEINN